MKKLNRYMWVSLLGVFLSVNADAFSYDTYYDDPFMQEEYEKIVRFAPLQMDDTDELDDDVLLEVKKIAAIIKENIAKRDVEISILGFAQKEDDNNETLNNSKAYARLVEDALLHEGVAKKSIYLNFRGALDDAYTDYTSEGQERNNRVLVALYVPKPKDLDHDGDGVKDSFDRCKNTPKGAEVDAQGCPLDSDEDGVVDFQDKCANTPPNATVDSLGCPIDSDKDGVADFKDLCENTPRGVTIDADGCPVAQTLMIHFLPNSVQILESSRPEVEKFAQFLQDNPTYKAEIIGHTDSIGKASVNMMLSQKRANAVKEALVQEGVNPSRITTRGRGELDPIASNRTEEGRKANRRIEVKLSY